MGGVLGVGGGAYCSESKERHKTLIGEESSRDSGDRADYSADRSNRNRPQSEISGIYLDQYCDQV